MRFRNGALQVTAIAAMLGASQPALAQRAAENAVANAGDAFGSNVGIESTGIYNENEARGFSPKAAGNVRFDGIYFDQVASISGRLREGTAVKVGFASEDFPFHAPTGVVDYKLRSFPGELGTSVGYIRQGYGGKVGELDIRVPLLDGHLGITGGIAAADLRSTDGALTRSWGAVLRPIVRVGRAEFAPFITIGEMDPVLAHPLIVVSGNRLPEQPPRRVYLGQDWARGKSHNLLAGATLKMPITDRLSLRAGMFHQSTTREQNYTELFAIGDPDLPARHRLIADPEQQVYADSGEALLALRLGSDRVQHRLFAGLRARKRQTETGGSDVRDFGFVRFGERNAEPEPVFSFGAVNVGTLTQSSLMVGYTGRIVGTGSINLGLQKARYRARFHDARTGLVSTSRADPWLYNATIGIDLSKGVSAYVGTERGLEDSGTAPENAANRNEQLPATLSRQIEGGLRWKFPGGQLVASAFQIEKPYFTFIGQNFVEAGTVRHQGIEASLAGHFLDNRLSVVAGVLALRARVSGQAHDLGLVGDIPAGPPNLLIKLDLNYRTDLFGGLTPILALLHNGARAVGAQPLAGGGQLTVPGVTTIDLGLRQRFHVGKVPMSARAVIQNLFNAETWKVLAANTLQVEDRRRMQFQLTADF